MVGVEFDEYACNIRIVDEAGTEYILNLSKLYEKIEPEKSTWRHSEGKRITITLKKWLETKWSAMLKGK